LRTATFADGLAIHGGAPSHDYERLSNKVAHPRALSSLRYRPLYGLERDQSSKPNASAALPKARVNGPDQASPTDRHLDPTADFEWGSVGANAVLLVKS
jgi:hypothetical protein